MPGNTPGTIDDQLDNFEAEWRANRRPNVLEFLDRASEAERPALLLELVKLDLEYRLRSGEPVRVEELLERFPALHSNRDDTLELIALEYRVRLARAEAVSVEEYLGRFPMLADSLPAMLLRVHRGPVEVPGYEIQGEIGRGGMGIVYKVVDLELGRTAALKVVQGKGEARPEVEARFVEEARITGRLQHPGIPPVYRLGKLADGGSFLAMKLIEGRTQASRLSARANPGEGLPELLRVFEQICLTVSYAHAQGVIHRDLKPSNIMVGEFGEVQVMDWGLAKRTQSPLADPPPDDATTEPLAQTHAGTILGTPAYMPPEQARGEAVDVPADVFALGAVLCELLTGMPPYAGLGDTIEAARAGDLTSARQRLQACGVDELAALAGRCLAAEARARPADASVVAAAMIEYREGAERRFLEAERQRAADQAAAAGERKRRRVLWSSAVVSGLLLLAGILGTGIGLWRTAKQLTRAEVAERDSQSRLAVSYADQGRLRLQQGRWKEALDSFAEAVEAGHPESVSLSLNRARAYNAMGDRDAVLEEMKKLAERDDLDEEEQSLLHFWRGDVILAERGRSEEAIRHVRRTLEGKLPPAEMAYAKGILAESSPKAIEQFRAALQTDRLHHQAHYHLIFLLVMLGRHDEANGQLRLAESLFSDDHTFVALRALLAALAGDLNGARKAFDRVQSHWRDQRRANGLRLLIEVFHLGSRIEELSVADDPKRRALADRILRQTNEAFAGLKGEANGIDLFPLVAPPVMRHIFGNELANLPLGPLPFGLQTDARSEGRIKDLNERIRHHPDGMLLYYHGVAARRAGRWREAEASLMAAADGYALFPIQRMALLEAIEVIWRIADVHVKPDQEAIRRLVERLRRVARTTRPDDRGLSSADYEGLASKAWQCSETGLAHFILDRWGEHEPSNPRRMRLRAAIFFRGGAYGPAIEAGTAAKKMGKLDADIEKDLEVILYWSPRHLKTQAKNYDPEAPKKDGPEQPK